MRDFAWEKSRNLGLELKGTLYASDISSGSFKIHEIIEPNYLLKLSNCGVTSSYFKFVALAMLNVNLCAVGR